jgi:hypothetical protein
MKHLTLAALLVGLCVSLASAEKMEAPAQLQENLLKIEPGKSLNISDITTHRDFLPFTFKDSGPTLMFSDDPEYVKDMGICAQEMVDIGTCRLYLYNVNDTPSNYFKFGILLKNVAEKQAHVQILRRGVGTPSQDYLGIGKTALASFLKGNYGKTLKINPDEVVNLDNYWEKTQVRHSDLAHGFYEIYTDQPLEITFCGLPSVLNPIKTLSSMTALISHKTNAGRGLYVTSDRKVEYQKVIDTQEGVQRIRLVDGDIDTWVQGKDRLTGQVVKNAGNYGVLYSINLPIKSSDGRDLAVVIMGEPSGKDYCAYGGLIETMPAMNLTTSGIFNTPSDKWAFLDDFTGALVGIYRPGKNTQNLELKLSPPGSSCLPVDFFFIPVMPKK